MRVELIRAWVKHPVPLEDLAFILNLHYRELIQILAGKRNPSEQCMETLAHLFEEPVKQLFPEDRR